MVVGGIYNLVYVGDNTAYAKINGKRTIQVVSIDPELQYVQLYDPFGCPKTSELRSSTITITNKSVAFSKSNDQIYVPSGEEEWFKHSQRVTSLGEGMDLKILTMDKIQRHPIQSNRSPFCAHLAGAPNFGLDGISTAFNVEDETTYPYLQRVFVWWKTWEDMYSDFEKYGLDAHRR
ncbi:MAG: hypothetical protein WC087_03950 [Candidatus Paceibacterota bacterium]